MDIFWGYHKNWTILRGHFYAFLGFFKRTRYRMGVFLGGAKFQIFLGVLEIPEIFWG